MLSGRFSVVAVAGYIKIDFGTRPGADLRDCTRKRLPADTFLRYKESKGLVPGTLLPGNNPQASGILELLY